jgi:hypothetical protein
MHNSKFYLSLSPIDGLMASCFDGLMVSWLDGWGDCGFFRLFNTQPPNNQTIKPSNNQAISI